VRSLVFSSILSLQRLAIKYFLYVLDTHASSLSLDQIIFALRRLSAICAYHKKFDEALRFRNAERLVYESQILTIDVLEQPVAGAVDAAAGSLRPETDAVASAALKRDVHRAQQYERLARMFFESGNKPMAGEYTRHAIAARRGIAARYGVGELGDITPAMVRAATAVEEGASDYDQAVRRYVLKQRKTAAARPAAAAGDGDHDDEEEEEEHENGDGDGAVSLADAEGAGIVASLFAGDPTRPLLPVIDIFGVTAPSADADTYSASTTTAASGAAGGGEAAFGRAINSLAAGLSSDLAALERLDRERRLKEEAMRMDAAGNVLSVSAKDDILTALHRRGALSAAAAAVPTTTAVTADGNDSDGDEIDDLDDLLRDFEDPEFKTARQRKEADAGSAGAAELGTGIGASARKTAAATTGAPSSAASAGASLAEARQRSRVEELERRRHAADKLAALKERWNRENGLEHLNAPAPSRADAAAAESAPATAVSATPISVDAVGAAGALRIQLALAAVQGVPLSDKTRSAATAALATVAPAAADADADADTAKTKEDKGKQVTFASPGASVGAGVARLRRLRALVLVAIVVVVVAAAAAAVRPEWFTRVKRDGW
jgi:hypothetical protein